MVGDVAIFVKVQVAGDVIIYDTVRVGTLWVGRVWVVEDAIIYSSALVARDVIICGTVCAGTVWVNIQCMWVQCGRRVDLIDTVSTTVDVDDAISPRR